MLRKTSVAVLGALIASLLLVANGSSSRSRLPARLQVAIVGPTSVVPGNPIAYSITLRNTGGATFKQARLTLIPVTAIVRSSMPYKRSFRPVYKATVANWTVKNLKPGKTFKVRLMLSFPVAKGASSYGVLGEGMAPSPFVFVKTEKDVFYKPSA